MKKNKLENIVIKALNKEASKEELAHLEELLKKDKNRELFYSFVQADHFADRGMHSFDKDRAFKMFLNKIAPKKVVKLPVRKKILNVLKYAAVFLCILGGSYYYSQTITEELIINNEVITLQLDDGKIEYITSNTNKVIVDADGAILGKQQGAKIKYESEGAGEELVYNQLTVPFGKKFQLQLSDGTQVHLNAGTSLKYPVRFIKGKDRKVFLNGEAFFKVAKDAAHPFIVNATEVNVRVLGTEFNVSTYAEDPEISTVLVEGSVHLYAAETTYQPETATAMVPGELAAWDYTQKKMTVSKADTSVYTAWQAGVLIFNHIKLKKVITKLERNYNVKIQCEDKKVLDKILTARFENVSIEHVLLSFKAIYHIDYKIKNNQVIIN